MMDNQEQTDFFHLLGETRIKVTVIRHGENFMATIADWWMAVGTSPEDAVRKVVKCYEDEMSMLEGA